MKTLTPQHTPQTPVQIQTHAPETHAHSFPNSHKTDTEAHKNVMATNKQYNNQIK